MRKNTMFFLLVTGMLAFAATGCQSEKTAEDTVVESTEETNFGLTASEQKVYAEYAAGVLMKYNAGTNMRVLEGQRLVKAEEEEQAVLDKAQKRQEKEESIKESTKEEGSAASFEEESYVSDMASLVEMDMFSIKYSGYEIAESYPTQGDDVFMAMDATEGKRLLVTKFSVMNKSDSSQSFDMFSKQAKFKVSVNGKTYKSQYTLLMDDLSMYKGELEAGENLLMVLIFEIPENFESIGSMEMTITAGEKKGTMLLENGGSQIISEEESVESDAAAEEILSEDNDLAEEYMEALEAEEGMESLEEEEAWENQKTGTVTVVGSHN